MNKTNPKVVVVGGGVIGGMCAYQLARAGCEVSIVERKGFGAACSHGNCGYISPSHILPLAQPGTLTHTLKSMMQRNSPFAIKPRLSLEALRWFYKFARRCNRRDMLAAAEGIHAILQSSTQLYHQLVAEKELDCEWQERGNVFVFETQKGFEEFARTDKLLREEFGVGATAYPRDELIKLEPAIKPVVAGGWFYDVDCHLRPDKLMSSLRANLENRGVQFIENTEVKSILRENGRAKAVVAGSGEIAADHFIIATGAWTPFLNRELGCKIPIQPGKGYSITMPAPKRMPKIPIIFEDTHVAITPMEIKYRIGSTMEFVGYNESIHPRRLSLLRASAERYLHDPMCEPIEEAWFGWRPMTWDSKPIIDRSPAMKNVWICAGHSMLGISCATGSGQLIRELVLDEKPHIDPAHYSISRFQK
jgi:D-amino-acid dehydrogenase